MRRFLTLTAALAVMLTAFPVSAAADASGPPCDDSAGREIFTPDGWGVTFEAPAVTATNYGFPPTNHESVTALRSAHFHLHSNFYPRSLARVTIRLSWGLPSDYDLFVYDTNGKEIGASLDDNLDEGTTQEEVVLWPLAHCRNIHIWVRSFAGAPVQPLHLEVEVSGLHGAQPPQAPGPDFRQFVYLGGGPGQTGMVGGDPTNLVLPTNSALTTARPTGGTPNQFTRLVPGPNSHRHSTQAHFTGSLGGARWIGVDMPIQLWLSSATMDVPGQQGAVHVRAFGDGVELGTHPIRIEGNRIGASPAPFTVSVRNVNRMVSTLTLQVSAEPVVSDQGARPLGHASFTVWYGSVQFPARIMLP